MQNYNLYQIIEHILKWYKNDINNLVDDPNCITLTKNERDILIIDMNFKNCLAQIVVADHGFAPCHYVFFEALALNSKKFVETNQPDLIYFFYDSPDMNITEIIDNLNFGVKYCANYIPEELEKIFMNKQGIVNIENERLSRVIHPDDVKKVNKEVLYGEFTCIGSQFQYIVIKNNKLKIRILPGFFNVK